MPSLGSILSIASSSLRAQHEAMNVTAHNIANAGTEGYVRQVPVLVEPDALVLPNGVFGSGVEVMNVVQVRDVYIDQTYRRELGVASENSMRSGLLGRMEGILGEPGDTGLGSSLDRFFSAFSELATNPTNNGVRTTVREAGRELADHFNRLAAGLDVVRQDAEDRLLTSVKRINELSAEVAGLNERIVAAESGGRTAGDLRNARARAIDELAGYLPVQVTQRDNGSVGLLTSGISLVDGANHNTLEIRNAGGQLSVAVTTQVTTMNGVGGSVGGLLQVLNSDLPGYRTRLDDLAGAVVTEVNSIHATGRNPDGNTGVDFFDGTALTASSMALSADVIAGTGAIAAGTEDGSGQYQSGANDVALALAQLRDADDPTLGTTYGEYLGELVSDLGLAVRSSDAAVEVSTTLVNQADIQRQSISGVSVDEEMVKLIQFQAAYQAAARVITTADEMLQTLLSI